MEKISIYTDITDSATLSTLIFKHASYFALMISSIPSNMLEEDEKRFINSFGSVTWINIKDKNRHNTRIIRMNKNFSFEKVL